MKNLKELSLQENLNISGGTCDPGCWGYSAGRATGQLVANFLFGAKAALDVIF